MSQTQKRHQSFILRDLQLFCDKVLEGGNLVGIRALSDLAAVSNQDVRKPEALTAAMRQRMIIAGNMLERVYAKEGGRRIFPAALQHLTSASAADMFVQRHRVLAFDTFEYFLNRQRTDDATAPPAFAEESLSGPETVPARRTTAPRSMESAASA